MFLIPLGVGFWKPAEQIVGVYIFIFQVRYVSISAKTPESSHLSYCTFGHCIESPKLNLFLGLLTLEKRLLF